MDNGDFGFVFRQILDELMIELVKIVKHDVFIFVARMEEGGRAVFVTIELKIFWRLSEAEEIGIFVFKYGVIQNVNVFDFI